MPHDLLTRLAIAHGSDKFGGHQYTPVYHELFADRRERPLKVLEIGVGGYATPEAGGHSLMMWASYFPYARIVGIDIEPKRLELPPRVRVAQGSQVDFAFLERLCAEEGPFDIVVDDGSHAVEHMKATFRFLYPRIAADGIYVVEDVQTSFSPGMGGHPGGQGTIFEVAHQVAMAMHCPEGHVPGVPGLDDLGRMTSAVEVRRNMVIFRRGVNTYPSNTALRFSNPEVVAVYEGIAEEARSNPSPYDCLSRIDMDIWAGRTGHAAALALSAAEAYPADRSLLYELVRMMNWANQPEARDRVSGMLDRIINPGKS